MHPFLLQQSLSPELLPFPGILETGTDKNGAFRLDAFPSTITEGIRIYFILEGRFHWSVGPRAYTLYPGDLLIIPPGLPLRSDNDVLEIGAFSWIQLHMERSPGGQLMPGSWSGLSNPERIAIGKVLSLNPCHAISRFAEAGKILKCIHTELFGQEIGYQTTIHHQIDALLIMVTRQMTRQSYTGRDFPRIFMLMEEKLRQNLSHQWTVEEMAAIVGMSATLFNEKTRSYTGFSPLNYLINIRISEAIKLLKRPEISVTDIALDTGFYSSQHFSTTFKRLTGYRPSEFRKNHLAQK